MAKLVVGKFDGDFDCGFRINLEIGWEGELYYRGIAGELPPAPHLKQSLTDWLTQYDRISLNTRIKPEKIIYNGQLNSRKKLDYFAQNLKTQLQTWLESPSFKSINNGLREELNRQETIRMLISCDRQELWQLPWHCWDLVENYPRLEIAFSYLNFQKVLPLHKAKTHSKVKILAILGHSQGIDVEADRDFLNSLTDAQVVFLVEPQRQELCNILYQESWDIIFFAGHSKTICERGMIYLNPEDVISLEELKYGLERAIAAGLQLAIFNSCDGLGLARELAQLSIPQAIIMRLPIPDLVAQKFVKSFLSAYAKENSLYLATKKAREELQGWEKQFPYGSWLPIIYQNPAINSPSWQDLQQTTEKYPKKPQKWQFFSQKHLTKIAWSSAIATIIVGLLQWLGWLQTGELAAYDRWMSWQPLLSADERILVITIDDADIKYQREQGMFLEGSLSDEALAQLLAKLKPHQPKAIASDIIHDFPFTPELGTTIAQTNNFFAICRVKSHLSQLVSISAPETLPLQQIGFSNLVTDRDRVIRRQLLGMSPDRVCQSDFSLGLRLALHYLDNVPTDMTEAGIKIGEVIFPPLEASSGAYQLSSADSKGYQILLNYRFAQPLTISLRNILDGSQDKNLETLVANKIVLIGGKVHNRDLHHTPLSNNQYSQPIAGVYIHAQMTSHIISTVLKETRLLWWLPNWVEFLWVTWWSVIGAIVVLIWRWKVPLAIALTIALTFVFASCFGVFLLGGWIPVIAPALALLLAAATMTIQLNIEH